MTFVTEHDHVESPGHQSAEGGACEVPGDLPHSFLVACCLGLGEKSGSLARIVFSFEQFHVRDKDIAPVNLHKSFSLKS